MKSIYTLFFGCLLLFLINEGLNISGVDLPKFFRFYLNDLLAIPIVLSICLFLTRFLHKDQSLRLGLFSVFSVAALYAVYFELYLPDRTERYTADVLDVACYFTGAVIFYLAQPNNRASNAEEKKLQKSLFSEVKE